MEVKTPASSSMSMSMSSGGGGGSSSAVEQAQELKDQGNDFFRKVCYFTVINYSSYLMRVYSLRPNCSTLLSNFIHAAMLISSRVQFIS